MSKIDDGLRAIMHESLTGFHWQAIETGMTGGGVPDTNWCRDGVEGWIECKRTSGWAVTLEPAQIGWIARRVRHGGRVHVAVRRRHPGGPRLGPPVDQLWLFPGRWVKEARVQGLRAPWAARYARRWAGGPASWDWDAVAEALLAGA